MKVKWLLVLVAGPILLSSCSKAQPEGRVIAEVNGSKLTYEFLLDQLPEAYRNSVSEAQLDKLVEAWIETELMYQEALKHNLDKDQKLLNIISQKRKDVIAASYAEMTTSGVFALTDQAIDSIYRSNPEQYKVNEEMFKLSHIVMSSQGGAEAVYKRLQAGESFAALAGDYSEDQQSRKNGGDLGLVPASAIENDMVNALNLIGKGKTTPPIKSQSGYYHIFLLHDRLPVGTALPLQDIKQEIAESIEAQGQQQKYLDLLDDLKRKADIKRYPINAATNK